VLEDQGRFAEATRGLHAIRRMIENRQHPTGGRLPTERNLAAQLETGRRNARLALEPAPRMAHYTVIAIFLVVLGFNLLGDGLRDALDPRDT